jgi:hypothetical protein
MTAAGPARKEDGKNRRLAVNGDADRRVVIVLRQLRDRKLPFVVMREGRQRSSAQRSGPSYTECRHRDELEAFLRAHRVGAGATGGQSSEGLPAACALRTARLTLDDSWKAEPGRGFINTPVEITPFASGLLKRHSSVHFT